MVRRAEKQLASLATHELGVDHNRLLFNFLRISPSYALICKSGGKRVTRATPAASRQIIQTFRKYGDVYQVPFENWSGSRWGMSGKTTLRDEALLVRSGQTIQCPDGHDGIFIPSDLGQKEKLALAKRLIQSLQVLPKSIEPTIRSRTLWKALAAVYERAKHPDIELWRIGLLSNLVNRFTGHIDPWCTKKLARDAEMRRHLTLMVVRAIFLALLVSENAARGFFPMRTPVIDEQLEFPFSEQRLHRLLSAHNDAEYSVILNQVNSRIK